MFDVAPTELLLVIVVALVVIGPKDLPKAMRFVGKWVGKARGMVRHFRAGLDTMMREAELEELEKQWREQNEAIMREFPRVDDIGAPATTATDPAKADPAAAATKADTPPETHIVPPKDGPLP
jgi:sec-independent protein translocase protein TatB